MANHTSENKFELIVVEGNQAGARASLATEGVTTVGTALDCDIVLAGDAAQNPHRIEVLAENGNYKIQIIEGSLSIDGITSDTTEAFYVAPGTRVVLGSSVFSLRSNTDESVSELQLGQSDPSQNVPRPAKAKSRFATLASSAALGLCLVFAGVATYLMGDKSNQEEVPAAPDISQLVSDGGFASVMVESTSQNAFKVHGRVATRSEHISLKSLLDATGSVVEFDVSVDEVFTEDVAAIYRLSGVEANVEMTGPGAVDVTTAVANTQLLDAVEARANQDVPGLTELVRFNTPPPVLAEEETPDFTSLPGKRIKMVVTTEPAFILTEDGSRYFKGAILPSGYKIKSIFEKTVQLERDNKIVDLIF